MQSPKEEGLKNGYSKARILVIAASVVGILASYAIAAGKIGQEVAIPVHLQDGLQMTPAQLAAFGKKLFTAMWTSQEGAGRPMTKGTGNPISDPTSPLIFPRNFNRVSGPDTNSCSGCHNKPDIGRGGDIVGNVFVLGQRFDFATFDSLDPVSNPWWSRRTGQTRLPANDRRFEKNRGDVRFRLSRDGGPANDRGPTLNPR